MWGTLYMVAVEGSSSDFFSKLESVLSQGRVSEH